MKAERNNYKGFTIIELMVVVALSSFLLLGVIQIFSANSQNYRFSTAFARMQDNGRIALEEIARDIRMAGYIGCASRQQIAINSVANNFPPDVTSQQHITGFDSGTGFNPAGQIINDTRGTALNVCDAVRGNTASCRVSDILQIIRSAETIGVTTNDMANSGSVVTVSANDMAAYFPAAGVGGTPPLQEDLMLITDCQRADLFRASAVTPTNITPNTNLQTDYPADSFLMPLVGATYFIATDGRDRDNDGVADPVATLYRMGISDAGILPQAVPIARGVEALEFSYGEDTQGDQYADVYRNTAAAVTDFTRVVSIRVAILLKSENDFITDTPAVVTFLGNNIGGGDRRLRLQFFTTVGLRNRVP